MRWLKHWRIFVQSSEDLLTNTALLLSYVRFIRSIARNLETGFLGYTKNKLPGTVQHLLIVFGYEKSEWTLPCNSSLKERLFNHLFVANDQDAIHLLLYRKVRHHRFYKLILFACRICIHYLIQGKNLNLIKIKNIVAAFVT